MEDTKERGEFAPGTEVIYGFHGRCSIEAIENRNIGDQAIRFYKLQVQKPTLSRSKKSDPAIWLPVDSARRRGLRMPMTVEAATQIFAILGNREYYFSVETPWTKIHSQLEQTIFEEGALGLAKVMSFLFILKSRQIVPSPEVIRFSEMIHKQLVRELAETLQDQMKPIEDKIASLLKNKLKADH
ncbi:MAG: hypothetical protein AB7P04_15640 [Bacteriovoracia bacterium]